MSCMEIQLSEEQSAALDAIKTFLLDDSQDAFILRGSAGTGKTTLIAKLVETLEEMNLSCSLLAPTGRAPEFWETRSSRSPETLSTRDRRSIGRSTR